MEDGGFPTAHNFRMIIHDDGRVAGVRPTGHISNVSV
jgi:hypothetical protein